MNRAALTLLALLALAGCRHPKDSRDYDAVRQRSAEQHQSMDSYNQEVTAPQ